MAEYDWISTAAFQQAIEDKIKVSAGQYGTRTYSGAIPDVLFSYAQQNRQKNERQELIKTASQRRGIQEALSSVDLLVKYGCEIAIQEGSANLTEDHIRRAYKEKFCRFWPFC